MKEISLNILDISKNSTKAFATKIEVSLSENTAKNILEVKIVDNGCGMDEEFLKNVLDPFTTTRTTRKVGLGLPLFKLAAEQAGGMLEINSKVGIGTTVVATFEIDNIDRMPIGDLAGTFVTLVQGNPDVRFVLTCCVDEKSFSADTQELKEALGDVPLDNPEVLMWINGYVSENLEEIKFIN